MENMIKDDFESFENIVKLYYEKGYIDSGGRYRREFFPSLWNEDYYIGPLIDMSFLKK